MRYPDARLLLMARAPVAGESKTRLIPALGAEGAALLQGYLVERQVRQALSAGLAPLSLWGAGECGHPLFRRMRQRYAITLHCQQGRDLGARMAHAVSESLVGAHYVILFGSDIPELDGNVLHQSCQAMEEGVDAVLVPAEDGGYALIGLRCAHPALFSDIDWGSDRVMAQTRERMKRLGWRWVELAPLWDLDRPQDLSRFSRLRDLPPPVRKLLELHSGKGYYCNDVE